MLFGCTKATLWPKRVHERGYKGAQRVPLMRSNSGPLNHKRVLYIMSSISRDCIDVISRTNKIPPFYVFF